MDQDRSLGDRAVAIAVALALVCALAFGAAPAPDSRPPLAHSAAR
jgi:hypothetical protein